MSKERRRLTCDVWEERGCRPVTLDFRHWTYLRLTILTINDFPEGEKKG